MRYFGAERNVGSAESEVGVCADASLDLLGLNGEQVLLCGEQGRIFVRARSTACCMVMAAWAGRGRLEFERERNAQEAESRWQRGGSSLLTADVLWSYRHMEPPSRLA